MVCIIIVIIIVIVIVNRLLENVNTLSQILLESDSLRENIQWIGHMKPDYKTKLNFTSLTTLEDVTTASHPDAIQLYAILSSAQKDNSFITRLTNLLQQYSTSVSTPVLVSPFKLVVRVVPGTVSQQVLEILKQQEEVHWIENSLPMALLNAAGNEILQGDGTDILPGKSKRPLWDRGLTGKGEIIGVGDTGIDYDNCFFRDTNQSVTFNSINMNHRKIIGYYTVEVQDPTTGIILKSDTKDGVDGHGTHVTGSVGGAIESSESELDIAKFGGVGRDAKLFFTDIQNTLIPSLLVPHDLYSDYFPIPYKAGARIHSNSWGCSNSIFQCEYNCNCVWAVNTQYGKRGEPVSNEFCHSLFGTDCCKRCNVYDSNAIEIDRFVYENDDMLIVFAAGNDGVVSKTGTVGSPSTSKNCLTVGASQTTSDNFQESIEYEDFQEIFDLLVSKGYNIRNEDQCCRYTSANNPKLQELIHSLCCPSYMQQKFSDKKLYNRENMASFSSRGPTTDGRIKPDVVGPGYKVISMHSDGNPTSNQCGTQRPSGANSAALLTNQGTSMATPLISGSASLVRQYYREFMKLENPSGSLIKATMIHSTKQLSGTVALDGQSLYENIPKGPNPYSGFGLVSLQRALAFVDSAFKLFVYDRTAMTQNENHLYCFQVKNMTDFRATLTYYDPPASAASKNILVNDLNLDVFYFLNGSKTSFRIPGNDNFDGDNLNTVEQSDALNVPSNYTIAVTVHGARVKDVQKYSLVMTGAVEYMTESCTVPPAGNKKKKPIDPNFYIYVGAGVGGAALLVIGVIIVLAYIVVTRSTPKNIIEERTPLASQQRNQYYRPNQRL
jgi:subtilisin family serine protease